MRTARFWCADCRHMTEHAWHDRHTFDGSTMRDVWVCAACERRNLAVYGKAGDKKVRPCLWCGEPIDQDPDSDHVINFCNRECALSHGGQL